MEIGFESRRLCGNDRIRYCTPTIPPFNRFISLTDEDISNDIGEGTDVREAAINERGSDHKVGTVRSFEILVSYAERLSGWPWARELRTLWHLLVSSVRKEAGRLPLAEPRQVPSQKGPSPALSSKEEGCLRVFHWRSKVRMNNLATDTLA